MSKAPKKSEVFVPRSSSLDDLAVQGRFGADHGTPGVLLSVVHPMSLVMVIASKGKSKALKDTLSGLKNATVSWAGPDQFYISAPGRGEGALYRELQATLDGIAAVTDQSHGRVFIRIVGKKARAVLAKGTPIDLHTDEFLIGKSALTQMAHVGIHLSRTGEDEFMLSVFRGFSESFWEWLTEQSEEFGYQVL